MHVKSVAANRFSEICKERNIKINELATLSGVTPSITTIKKFCDILEITSDEFFSTLKFDSLEQEIC